MKFIGYRDFKSKGIPWSRMHVFRKIRQGQFPKPVKLGAQTNAWPESEIDQWLADRVAQRDAQEAK
jgi:prophage regulatory protein